MLFLLLCQPAHRNFHQFREHVIFRLGVIVDTGEFLINGRRMHDDVSNRGKRTIILCLLHSSAGIRDELTDQIGDFRVCAAGHQRVR